MKDAKKIFIGGVPNRVTKQEIFQCFSKYGIIDDICLPLESHESKKNKGFCFVTFQDSESVYIIIKNYKKHFLRHKWVDVKIAKPRSNYSPNSKAYK